MSQITPELARQVLDRATSLLMATRADHELFIQATKVLFEAAKEAESLKKENETLKSRIQ